MGWQFDNDKPIYLQIVNIFKLKIISFELHPGEKLSSVRDLAEIAGVNPNTMQRALSELEREGLVYANRTSGRFVTEDEALINQLRDIYAKTCITEFVNNLLSLGYTNEQMIVLVNNELDNITA